MGMPDWHQIHHQQHHPNRFAHNNNNYGNFGGDEYDSDASSYAEDANQPPGFTRTYHKSYYA
jgi:hypothetical protein